MVTTLITYFQQGGVFMYPILAGSLWGITLIIERHLFYQQAAHRINAISSTFFTHLNDRGYTAATAYLKDQHGIMPALLITACNGREKPITLLEKNLEEVVLEKTPALEHNLNTLSVLAGLMPILGLLGTVTGMIATFQVIAIHGTSDAKAMADGISEALITTQAGLVSSLPLILGHLFLGNRYKRILAKIQESATKVLNYVQEHGA